MQIIQYSVTKESATKDAEPIILKMYNFMIIGSLLFNKGGGTNRKIVVVEFADNEKQSLIKNELQNTIFLF